MDPALRERLERLRREQRPPREAPRLRWPPPRPPPPPEKETPSEEGRGICDVDFTVTWEV
jgi:hypothetical protein